MAFHGVALTSLTPDEAAVLRRLEGWINRFNRIEELFDREQGEVPAADQDEARERYMRLKRDLEAEYRSTADSARRPPLTDAEHHWYAGTVYEAYVHLRADASGLPSSWFASLLDAREDLEHTIFTLRRWDQRVARPGDLLPGACPHCANELRALKYFEHWMAPAGGPRVDEPFWVTRCSDCERRYSYLPTSGALLEHRAIILPFSPSSRTSFA